MTVLRVMHSRIGASALSLKKSENRVQVFKMATKKCKQANEKTMDLNAK
jgi:hypothetical protein